MTLPDDLTTAFAALADPTRAQLLARLGENGPSTATTLSRGATVSRQAIVKHLGVLQRAGLVSTFRSGREVRHVVDSATLRALAEWLNTRASEWDIQLLTAKQHLESTMRSGHPSEAGSTYRSPR